jgi:hypothetical protein
MIVSIYFGRNRHMYDCDSAHFYPTDDNSKVIIRIEKNKKILDEWEITKEKGNEVYFMNENGKTFDSYKW